MKKNMFVVLLLLSLRSAAQVIVGPEVSVGSGRSSFADPANPGPATHFFSSAYGISLWSVQASRINVMTGLRYTSSLNALRIEDSGSSVVRSSRSRYLNLPARITFRVMQPSSSTTVAVYAGPELSYWMGSTISIRRDDGSILFRNKVHAGENGVSRAAKFQYGYQIGVSLLKRMGKQNWAVSLQYSHTMSKQFIGDVAYTALPGLTDNYAFKSESLMLTGTYYLDFSSRKKGRARNKYIRHHWRTDL